MDALHPIAAAVRAGPGLIPPWGTMGPMDSGGGTMTDPVCGMAVTPESSAGAWEHDGVVYYFCSPGCMERFRGAPEHFLGLDPDQRHM